MIILFLFSVNKGIIFVLLQNCFFTINLGSVFAMKTTSSRCLILSWHIDSLGSRLNFLNTSSKIVADNFCFAPHAKYLIKFLVILSILNFHVVPILLENRYTWHFYQVYSFITYDLLAFLTIVQTRFWPVFFLWFSRIVLHCKLKEIHKCHHESLIVRINNWGNIVVNSYNSTFKKV